VGRPRRIVVVESDAGALLVIPLIRHDAGIRVCERIILNGLGRVVGGLIVSLVRGIGLVIVVGRELRVATLQDEETSREQN
jgi:hypothetical protein